MVCKDCGAAGGCDDKEGEEEEEREVAWDMSSRLMTRVSIVANSVQ